MYIIAISEIGLFDIINKWKKILNIKCISCNLKENFNWYKFINLSTAKKLHSIQYNDQMYVPLQSYQTASFVLQYNLQVDGIEFARYCPVATSHIEHLLRILEFWCEGKCTKNISCTKSIIASYWSVSLTCAMKHFHSSPGLALIQFWLTPPVQFCILKTNMHVKMYALLSYTPYHIGRGFLYAFDQ